MRLCAGDDKRRNARCRHRMNTKYYGTTGRARCTTSRRRAEARTTRRTTLETMTGTRHCEIHTFYDFRREVICLFCVWIQVFYTTATRKLPRGKPPGTRALPSATAVQLYSSTLPRGDINCRQGAATIPTLNHVEPTSSQLDRSPWYPRRQAAAHRPPTGCRRCRRRRRGHLPRRETYTASQR